MTSPDAADAAADYPGQSAFNPFGSIGVVVQAPPVHPAEPQGGDWSLALVALLAGFACIGWMMRKMLD